MDVHQQRALELLRESTGAYLLAGAVTPGDLTATLFSRFGVDPRQEIRDPLGRPAPLAEGRPLRSIFPGVARDLTNNGAVGLTFLG